MAAIARLKNKACQKILREWRGNQIEMFEAQKKGGQRYLDLTSGRRRNYLSIRPTATLYLEKYATTVVSGKSASLRSILSIFSELYTDVGLPFQSVILDESQNAKNIQGFTFKTIKTIDTKIMIIFSIIFMNNK